MKVYSSFLKFSKTYKNRIIFYFLFFFINIIIMTSQSNMDIGNSELDIGIINNSDNRLAKELIDYIGTNNNLIYIEDNITDIRDEIMIGNYDVFISIPKTFKEDFLKGKETIELISDNKSYASIQINSQINRYLRLAYGNIKDNYIDYDNMDSILNEKTSISYRSVYEYRKTVNNNIFSFYFNFAGYILLSILAGVFGSIMTEFNRESLEIRTMASSKKFIDYKKEILLAQLSISTVIVLLIFAFSIILNRNNLEYVNLLKYFVNILVYSFVIISLMFLINTLTDDLNIKNMISNIFSLGISFISGMLVDISVLPDIAIKIARFFPAYYYVIANNKMVDSVWDIKRELFIQVLFGVIYILLGLLVSKNKRRDDIDYSYKI